MFSSHPLYETGYPTAHIDDEVIEHVRRALNSDAARAVVRSLIAKGDEARPG